MVQIPTHSDCTFIGKVIRTNGTDGEVLIRINPQTYIDIDSISHLFIEINGKLVPFSYQSLLIKKNSLFIHFTDITTESHAEEFLLQSVFVENSSIIQQNATQSDEYIGYSLFDKDVYIGTIEEILEFPMHEVFRVVTTTNKEILIPHAKNLILEHKIDEKIIIMDVPEGLIDVYLS